MRFNNLNDWLNWQESLNPAEIELGLERVSEVSRRAGHASSFDCPLITVAGTNGKGSVVAMLEAMAISAGLNVCSYTSPHIFRYNERIKINSEPVTDDALCQAFEHVDQARGEYPLTYFEFGTLAAIELFFKQRSDLIILEVGLGGRLDAVNIMDADVSILTSIAIDHVDWLGDNRGAIGYEKAGIFRSGQPVICGDRDAPISVLEQAEKLHCEFMRLGEAYEADVRADGDWGLRSPFADIPSIAAPSLEGRFQYFNAAAAIVALQTLQIKGLLAADQTVEQFDQAIIAGLKEIKLPARFQKIHTTPKVYVDVAHNLQAAQALVSQLASTHIDGVKTWTILAMLSDKDIEGVVEGVSPQIDRWCFAGLESIPRGLSVNDLSARLPDILVSDNGIKETNEANQCKMSSAKALQADSVTAACKKVLSMVDEDDRIIIFGSFYTAAEAMQFFSDMNDIDVKSIV
ncbi:MAG TPA: bifunctional folylpolyglutamate synthase/dihydrofolate synthase [Gammaproteobacteria bacterium]|nr:bifunctional folylpolyglutamate synthase/dihydrofolate synthase [Gammaproteobacteria bacterium]